MSSPRSLSRSAPPARRRRPRWGARGALALALASLLRGAPAGAQEGAAPDPAQPCARVGSIEILNNSLFAPREIEERPFNWALGVVNGVHMRTRSDYLRSELLVAEGGCFNEVALAASVRNLRDLDFIARVEADSRLLPDSTIAVRVETWDEWSTQAGVDFDIENSFQFKGFNVAEKNALGRGLRASFRYRSFRERKDKSFTLASVRFLGTRAQASVSGGTTRTGSFLRQDLSQPFATEAGALSFQSRVQYEDREHPWLTGDRDGVSHLLLPLTDRSAYVLARRRLGVPGRITVLGGELDVLRRTRSGAVRQVAGFDFDGATPAADSLALRLRPQDAPDSHVRVGASLGVRRIRFTTATGLDLLSGVQNVALGSELIVTLGRTLGSWGTSRTDSYARMEGYASGAWGPLLANVSAAGQGRRLDGSAGPAGSRWRDLAVVGQALLYAQPPPVGLQTMVTGVSFNLRRNLKQPYQVALGGEGGVRGYREDDLPTGSTVVLFAEERVNLPWFHPAVGLGLTAFADWGRGWAADVPFGQDTGWRGSIGGGLRFGFPAGSGTVTRLEVAWPLGPAAAGRGPVIRTYWSPVQTRR